MCGEDGCDADEDLPLHRLQQSLVSRRCCCAALVLLLSLVLLALCFTRVVLVVTGRQRRGLPSGISTALRS